jgi:hypothetical protein
MATTISRAANLTIANCQVITAHSSLRERAVDQPLVLLQNPAQAADPTNA